MYIQWSELDTVIDSLKENCYKNGKFSEYTLSHINVIKFCTKFDANTRVEYLFNKQSISVQIKESVQLTRGGLYTQMFEVINIREIDYNIRFIQFL